MLAEEAAAVDAGEIVGRRELAILGERDAQHALELRDAPCGGEARVELARGGPAADALVRAGGETGRSEEHTSELQSRRDLVCRLLLEKKKKTTQIEQTQEMHAVR